MIVASYEQCKVYFLQMYVIGMTGASLLWARGSVAHMDGPISKWQLQSM